MITRVRPLAGLICGGCICGSIVFSMWFLVVPVQTEHQFVLMTANAGQLSIGQAALDRRGSTWQPYVEIGARFDKTLVGLYYEQEPTSSVVVGCRLGISF